MVITQTAGHLEPRWTQERFGIQTFKSVNVANTPGAVVTAARQMLKMGADQIKTMVTGGLLSRGANVGEQNMSDEEIAARAGVTVIEHCATVDDEGIRLMAENAVALAPTFSVLKLIAEKGPEAGVSADAVGKSAALAPRHLENVKKAYDAGARVVFGTDTGTPLGYHGRRHQESVLMEEAGITEPDILLSASPRASSMSAERTRMPSSALRNSRTFMRRASGMLAVMPQQAKNAPTVPDLSPRRHRALANTARVTSPP